MGLVLLDRHGVSTGEVNGAQSSNWLYFDRILGRHWRYSLPVGIAGTRGHAVEGGGAAFAMPE